MREKPATKAMSWSYTRGLVYCVIAGVLLGVFFALAGIVIWFMQGEYESDQGSGGLLALILIYVLGYSLSGLIAGLLNPIGKTRVGAALIGVIAILPLTLGIAQFLTGELWPTDPDYAIATLTTAVILGICAGLVFHHEVVQAWT